MMRIPGRSFPGPHGDCTTDHPHTHAASQPGPTPDDAESAEKDVCDGCQKRPCVCETVVLPNAEKDAPCSHPGWVHIGSERYCAACGVDRDDLPESAENDVPPRCLDCGSTNLHEGPNDPPPWCCCMDCGSANVSDGARPIPPAKRDDGLPFAPPENEEPTCPTCGQALFTHGIVGRCIPPGAVKVGYHPCVGCGNLVPPGVEWCGGCPIPPGSPPCEVHVPGRDEPSPWCAACRASGASTLPPLSWDPTSGSLDKQ